MTSLGVHSFGVDRAAPREHALKTWMWNTAAGLAAGYVATKASDFVGGAIEEATPAPVRAQERRVSPGPSAQVAAEKMAEWAGTHLNRRQRRVGALGIHLVLGALWGAGHGQFRQHTDWHPVTVALASGLSLGLVVDEGVSPALGFSAPPSRYPWLTHARSLANHIVWGLTCGAVYELLKTSGGKVR